MIIIQGRHHKITKKELRAAIEFMLQLLIKSKTNLELTIIPKKFKTRELYGLTIPNPKSNNKFKIYINKSLSRKKCLLTLAHELVHVKQIYKNELGVTLMKEDGAYTKWHQKMYKENDYYYFDLPWEIEANGREHGMYKLYMDKRKRQQLGGAAGVNSTA